MDQRGMIATAVFIGMMVWVTLTAAVIDPLLRRLIFKISGIELERRFMHSTSTAWWDSVTPGRGQLLGFFYPFLVLLVIILPLVVVSVVAAIRWYAAHPVAQ